MYRSSKYYLCSTVPFPSLGCTWSTFTTHLIATASFRARTIIRRPDALDLSSMLYCQSKMTIHPRCSRSLCYITADQIMTQWIAVKRTRYSSRPLWLATSTGLSYNSWLAKAFSSSPHPNLSRSQISKYELLAAWSLARPRSEKRKS